MAVNVEPDELRDYGKMLVRNGLSAEKARSYVDEWAGSEMEAVAAEGLFAKMLDIHDSTRDAVKDSVLQIGVLVRNSGQELEKAAKFYEDADEKAKQNLDAKAKRLMFLGGSGTTTRPDGAKTAKNYADVKDTAEMFKGTPGYHDVVENDPMKQGFVGNAADVLELSSIASWIFGTIQGLTGRDLLDELTKEFTGDWEAWAKCAGTWRALGEWVEAIGENMEAGNNSMDAGWEGRASEDAYDYFRNVASGLKSLKGDFDSLGSTYDAMAQFIYASAEVIKDLLKTLVDAVIAYATRGYTAVFSVPAFVKRIIKLVKHIADTVANAKRFISVMKGIAAGFSGNLGNFLDRMPSRAYDLVGV